MRIAGLVLLFAGFTWDCWTTFSIRPIARAVFLVHAKGLRQLPDKAYSREEVENEMRDTTLDTIGRYPSFSYPGLTMLAGGLMLAGARRPSKAPSNDA